MIATTIDSPASRLRPCQAGVTLVEVVASVCILSVLLAAMGSGILIASRAAEITAQASAKDAKEAIARIAADLQVALTFSERTDTAVTFTVPDRNGDDLPETIRYAWPAVAGEAITREYNGAAPVTLAEDVHFFGLSYLLETTSPSGPVEQESQELVLMHHDNAPGGNFQAAGTNTMDWVAQYFKPALPTNTVSWTITRVQFRAKSKGKKSGTIRVGVSAADAALKPTGEPLESVLVAESTLGKSFGTEEISFGALAGLDPAAGYCLTFAGLHPSPCGEVQWERDGSPMTAETHFMTSTDGGATWSAPNDTQDLRFWVYGTVTTLGAPEWP